MSEEVERFRGLLAALLRRFSISERADVQCCGMTVAQAATLEALGREGALRLGQLGTLLGIAPSTLTRNLGRLETSGLVRRLSDTSDGRAARVELTEKGRRAWSRIERLEDAFAARVLDRLSPVARERALDGLDAILGAVRAETESCCPGAFDHLVTIEGALSPSAARSRGARSAAAVRSEPVEGRTAARAKSEGGTGRGGAPAH